ncbi:MAG: metallopeptidase family protein [Planctomycetaceae bacterium]
MTDLFDELDALAEEGELEAMEARALQALRRAGADHAQDLWRYVAWARLELGRPAQALDAARRAGDALTEARALFHGWDFEGARGALARCRGEGDDAAEAEWYRGLVAEFTGREDAAHFREAARLAPDLFREPVRLDDREVDRVIREALDALPPVVARAAADAVVQVTPLPAPHPDVDPLTLGLYTGVSHLDRSVEAMPHLPARIEIFRRNIERLAGDRENVVEELRITLLHELGHHLGYGEEGLEELGLG